MVAILGPALWLSYALLSMAQPPQAPPPDGKPGEKHVFGKYFKPDGNNHDNSLWLYRPTNGAIGQSPTVVYLHPGGFVGMAPEPVSNEKIDAWNHYGFSYLSVGYRLTGTKYYYNGTDGTQKLEEWIDVSSNGLLTLDTTGNKTMKDWHVYAGRQDVITKCMYDAVEALKYVIQHQVELGVDPHRLIFQTGSAGTGISNYLTFVYQRANPGLFHTSAVIYSSAQLVYPVEGLLQRTWELISSHMEKGNHTPLSHIFTAGGPCKQMMGNVACPGMASKPTDYQYDLCNETWNQNRDTKFCEGDGFESLTIADAIGNQNYTIENWHTHQAEYRENMKMLWYNDRNIYNSPTGADYIYVANSMNGTSDMDLPHLAVYAQSYADVCRQVGCKYTVYFTNYTGMTPVKSATKVRTLQTKSGHEVAIDWNYESNMNWRETHAASVSNIEAGGAKEQLLFGCSAVGYPCYLESFFKEPTSPPTAVTDASAPQTDVVTDASASASDTSSGDFSGLRNVVIIAAGLGLAGVIVWVCMKARKGGFGRLDDDDEESGDNSN